MRMLAASPRESVPASPQESRAETPPPVAKSAWGLSEGEVIVPGRSAIRLLGGGERYEAYLAWDDRLLSLVVVKVLRPALVHDAGTRDAMAAEAATLTRLSHPVIMRCFDAILEGERPHLVLEYVDGPRLSTLLRTSVVALEQTLSLGAQLAAAAHYMSTLNVVHLDIKPQNIIMAGPARLIDLSIARRIDKLGDITSPIGTTKYMAPEQSDPSRFNEIGSASDVWGIGVTLYWMLAGRSPFPPPADEAAASWHRPYPQLAHSPAPLPGSVPPALSELVHATLSNDPAERPSAREVLEALEPLIAALPRPQLSRFRIPTKPRLKKRS